MAKLIEGRMVMVNQRLTKEQVQAIVELRRAKVRREREALIKRLQQMIRPDQQHRDYAPDEASEPRLAEEIISAYVGAVPGGEASFAELKDLLRGLAIDPRHVMTYAKRLLVEPEPQP